MPHFAEEVSTGKNWDNLAKQYTSGGYTEAVARELLSHTKSIQNDSVVLDNGCGVCLWRLITNDSLA